MKGLYILLSCALFALQAHAQSSTLKEESADLEALYEDTVGIQSYREKALRRIQEFTAGKYWELYSRILEEIPQYV